MGRESTTPGTRRVGGGISTASDPIAFDFADVYVSENVWHHAVQSLGEMHKLRFSYSVCLIPL